jgi:RimJ/RimL family protein N-acetyltransferase
VKLLFENWRQYLIEQANTVQIKFPDAIPPEMLALANKDPEISGFVYPEEDRQRAGIYFNDELVGFMTPRKEPDGGWRVGAIHIDPNNRGKGIGSMAIAKFFEDKTASPVPISVDNISSQKAFANAGFALLNPDEVLTDEKDGWKYQLWGRGQNETLI